MSLSLAGVGDLVVTKPLKHLRDQPHDSLLHVLERASFTIGNLEGPLTDAERGPRGRAMLRGAPELMSDVVAMGVDAVSLANNHAADPGWEALHEMVQDLEQAGLVTVGVGEDTADAFQPELRNVHGVDVALLAATCVGRWAQLAGPVRPGIAGVRLRTRYQPELSSVEGETSGPHAITTIEPEDRGRLLRAVQRARDLASFVAVTMHWGVSWSEQPLAYQRELGHLLVEAGASVVFGSHPHAVQGVEVYRGAPIFYSLGSFVFTRDRGPRRGPPGDTAVALVEVTGDGRPAGARMILGSLDATGEPVRAPSERAEILAEGMGRSSAGWGARMRLEDGTLKIDL